MKHEMGTGVYIGAIQLTSGSEAKKSETNQLLGGYIRTTIWIPSLTPQTLNQRKV